MKKAQAKLIFSMALCLIVMSFLVVAYERVTGEFPNNEWVLSNSIDFNFMANTTSPTIPWCAIYVNNSGSYELKANYTDIINATAHISGIAINDSAGFNVTGWNTTCYNGSDTFSFTVELEFGVDGTAPIVTLDSPASGSYISNLNETLFKFTPIDPSNLNYSQFYTNLSGTWEINNTNTSPITNSQDEVNLTVGGRNHTAALIPDGFYIWNPRVSDLAGQEAWGNENFTFIVDTVLPTAVIFAGTPAENSTGNDSTPLIEWKQTVELNFDRYDVLVSNSFDMSSPFQTLEFDSISSNSTNLSNIENDGIYFIQVRSYELSERYTNSTFVLNYTLDTVDPTITLNYPLNNSFVDSNITSFNVTVIDNNPDACDLYLTKVGGSTATLTKNMTTFAVNNSITNMTTIAMEEGVFRYMIECNDTRNAKVNISSSPLWITVDTIQPSPPNLNSQFHQTNSTNKIPVLEWTETVEVNFSRYYVTAKYENNGSIAYEINITSKTTLEAQMHLPLESTFIFNVTAFDLAGNENSSINSSTESLYYTDSVCAVLSTGWNLCGAIWSAPRSLSQIANETNASMVSVWNSSHQWATCNSQSSATGTHCDVTVNISKRFENDSLGVYDFSINPSVLIYVNQSTDWPNRTWEVNKFTANMTLTNASGIGWNLEAGYVRDGPTFGHLEDRFAGAVNVSMFSLPYNNGTSVPFVNNGLFKELNNNTILDYGRAIWFFFNGTGGTNLANSTYNVGVW